MNGIKFTPEGGSVWTNAGVHEGVNGDEIVFSVEDTGVGLEPGQVARVWDRFYQAEASSTRRFGGAGLGLSIVRRLAELHGGASSGGLDRGSKFSVYMPAAQGKSANRGPRSGRSARQPRPRLILAKRSPAAATTINRWCSS